MGWHTLRVDGHDRAAVSEAVSAAKAETDRPSLVACVTHIAYGAPTKQDTAASHGSPLGDEEIAGAKEAMGWPDVEPFYVPEEVYGLFAAAMEKGTAARRAWEQRRDERFGADEAVGELWRRYWEPAAVAMPPVDVAPGEKVATRKASGTAINLLAGEVPCLLGGSADLAPSNNTMIDGSPEFQRGSPEGRNFRFGVREHAMGAVVNGMALHGGLRPYGGTFLVFHDYMRPAVRLAALMGAPSIFVYTHDSVFLGEDGPTHQPVEHLAALRAIPNLHVVRPASAAETAEAWELALARTDGPTALVLTRQSLPEFAREGQEGALHRGGYVVRDGDDAVLVATGSEVWPALEAAEALAARGRSVRVVSLPCWEAFAAQDEEYRTKVLGGGLPVASVEAASTFGWERFTGSGGLSIGIDSFGASGPYADLQEHFGLTPEAVAERVEAWLAER
jgi:transketolase